MRRSIKQETQRRLLNSLDAFPLDMLRELARTFISHASGDDLFFLQEKLQARGVPLEKTVWDQLLEERYGHAVGQSESGGLAELEK